MEGTVPEAMRKGVATFIAHNLLTFTRNHERIASLYSAQ
jgi:hypothetical protein